MIQLPLGSQAGLQSSPSVLTARPSGPATAARGHQRHLARSLSSPSSLLLSPSPSLSDHPPLISPFHKQPPTRRIAPTPTQSPLTVGSGPWKTHSASPGQVPGININEADGNLRGSALLLWSDTCELTILPPSAGICGHCGFVSHVLDRSHHSAAKDLALSTTKRLVPHLGSRLATEGLLGADLLQ